MTKPTKKKKNRTALGKLDCDFTSDVMLRRIAESGLRRQPLARATGFVKGHIPRIVDTTAGLGRDAFLLASLGAEVTLIERSPAIHALLEKALAKAADRNEELAEIAARMTLLHGDAINLLPTLAPDLAEVVMVDPMHPIRKNSALVKKEMRQMREIVGEDPDAGTLMQTALEHASGRVVLKWPMRADPLPDLPPPSHHIKGKTVRYDVFMI